MMETSVIICEDAAGIASRALDLTVDGLRSGIGRRGEAHLALTGGSSATKLFELLRTDPRAARVDWTRVHVWQGDERFVPHDHPDRNWAVATRDWLTAEPAPGATMHPMPVDEAITGGHDADWAADGYARALEAALPMRDGIPSFDMLLLGVGGDGHILSTFPGTAPIGENERTVMAVAAPEHIEPNVERLTVTPRLLGAAGSIVVMVPGSAKAQVVALCVRSAPDPERWPAQLAIRPNAVWLLEPESAAGLEAS